MHISLSGILGLGAGLLPDSSFSTSHTGKYGTNRLGLTTRVGKRPKVTVAASKRAAAKRRNIRARSAK